MPKKILLIFCTALTLTIAQGRTAKAQSGLQLWTTGYVSSGNCRSHIGAVGPESFSQVVQGHKWPHTPGMGIEFIDHNAKHINAAAVGRANDKALLNRLLTAARGKAFTRLDFEGPGGSSPAFVSAIIVESVAYAVSYLRSRNAITANDLAEIDRWVGKLKKNSKQKSNSLDHKAALASSQLMWAAAVGNSADFKKARKQVNSVFGKLRSNPYFIKDLRNNNEVMQQMVHAAMVLRLNGIDVFNAKFGKHTFNEAIAYHAQQVLQNGEKPIKTAGDPVDQARSIMRSQGWGTHLAWIPVYLSAQSSGPAATAVRNLETYLRRSDRKPFWGIQMAVHTGCQYGR